MTFAGITHEASLFKKEAPIASYLAQAKLHYSGAQP